MWSQIVQLDTLRSIAYGSTSVSYAAVGTAFTHAARLVCFTNNTDGDMFISNDGVNDKLFIAANSFKLFDLTTNKSGGLGDGIFALPVGTIIYVRQSSTPTKGAVYVEVIYGNGDA
jgi:hypothetical protein